ncbi:hypothetical protein [Staphylococcus gallinarum]|uniref:hypothetical protein n=1 Tax=Staphylococcus gallinarum TaxID=1293 RepID=UPI001E4F8559|nr:hypothetical protein [Staphylococcus gallinarum]MCD8787452.1 hypothetical protein [Staphylococcus gallinarum]MCD8845259.1 hypothetical protein [Staphylococcus gallinarum]
MLEEFDYKKYLSAKDLEDIQQRIDDLYGETYLTGQEYNELFSQFADMYLHDEL